MYYWISGVVIFGLWMVYFDFMVEKVVSILERIEALLEKEVK